MIDFKTAQERRHLQNIARYCRLLATELTDMERQYLHKRIAEKYTLHKRRGQEAPSAGGDEEAGGGQIVNTDWQTFVFGLPISGLSR